MSWILLLVLIAIVGFGYYGSRQRKFVRKPKLAVDDHVTFPIASFRGRSIQFTENACSAVKELKDKRFLFSEAPELPVKNCNIGSCECTYIEYEDRRSGDNNRRKTLRVAANESAVDKRNGQPDRRIKNRS